MKLFLRDWWPELLIYVIYISVLAGAVVLAATANGQVTYDGQGPRPEWTEAELERITGASQ